MTFIHTIGDDAAEGAVAKVYQKAKAEGGVHETTRLLSLWPEAMVMEGRRYQTVMLDETDLSRAEKEMIATVVSAKNHCTYCWKHHMQSVVDAGGSPRVARQLVDDYPNADIDARIRAMLDFATMPQPHEASEGDVERLREHGFSDRQILEIIVVAGFFEDYNLRVSIFGLEMEDWA